MSSTPHGFLRVGAACPAVALADPDENARRTGALAHEAAARGTQVVVFPELGLTGYTCGDLFHSLSTLIGGAERALGSLLRDTADLATLLAVGLPVASEGRLFNAAVLLQRGQVLGVVPKSFLPGYKEYYEERWFSSAREALTPHIRLVGKEVPFGTDLVFAVEEGGPIVGVEICEDLWAPIPPSSRLALAGATVLLNLSASNELVAKADYRRELVRQQSGRTLSAYVYANAGVHESSTDLVFGGHLMIAENGALLAESPRFERKGQVLVTDVDTERLLVERIRQTSFADAVHPDRPCVRRVRVLPLAPPSPHRLLRSVDPHPFVPSDPAVLDSRCEEIFAIQSAGLARRLEHTRLERSLLGLSGGLDSTLALLVAARTADLLGRPRASILAVTMPGYGTTTRTLGNSRRLAMAVGAELREIDIRPACDRHIADIGLDPADRSSATYQNLQARERTQILMDLANLTGGIVVGTGDLSELALGFCTFSGDQMAMYNVNAGVPKTLVRTLVGWVADHRSSDVERVVLRDVLATPVSPELVPPATDGSIEQKTEEIVGPYELHDFFLYCLLRLAAGPSKTLFLAEHAFGASYTSAEIEVWLRVFIERFFSQQFKRSVMPDGPKVGSVSLSPRGDWRMPSDALATTWLREL